MCNTAVVQVMVLWVLDVCVCQSIYASARLSTFPKVPDFPAWPRGLRVSGGVVVRQQAAGQRQQRQHAQSVGHQDGEAERGPARPRRRGGRGTLRLPDSFVSVAISIVVSDRLVPLVCRFTPWTGVLMDNEWPAAGKTNVSECERESEEPSFIVGSFFLNICVTFLFFLSCDPLTLCFLFQMETIDTPPFPFLTFGR